MRAPEKAGFIAFLSWPDCGDRGNRIGCMVVACCIGLLTAVYPAIVARLAAVALAPLEPCCHRCQQTNGRMAEQALQTEEVNGAILSATFALHVDRVWWKTRHGKSRGTCRDG